MKRYKHRGRKPILKAIPAHREQITRDGNWLYHPTKGWRKRRGGSAVGKLKIENFIQQAIKG
jgi:hypothetical protein